MIAVVIVDTWMWSPFMMLIALAGLSAVPKYLYEAADVDRASSWFKFRWINAAPCFTAFAYCAAISDNGRLQDV